MPQAVKTRILRIGRSQVIRIPAQFRFKTEEVYVRRDPRTGDVILSPLPATWEEIFAALDQAGFPADFMADR